MLPNKYKLKQEEDFKKVYKLGKRRNFPLFTLRYFVGPNIDTKIAVVASIKEVGKANKRNLARRRIWAALAKTLKIMPKKGFLLIFTLRKVVLDEKWANISDNIDKIIKDLANISNKR